jgi:diguanylate cyclase
MRHGPGSAVAVVFVDLDGFKSVNDRFGHAVGDRLLVATADRLLGAVRTGDVVGRIGGDEFLVVASPVSSRAEARVIAERVARSLRIPIQVDRDELSTTPSIGVAWTDQPIEADALVAAADTATYAAKNTHDGQPAYSATTLCGP